MREGNDYDAVIIGAGISGLVCGCYLAKAGVKTLILEKNQKPGGCCSWFYQNGYVFDTAPHSLSSLRPGGLLRSILEGIEVYHEINFLRENPSQVIFYRNKKIVIFNSPDEVIKEFGNSFELEKIKIKQFIEYVLTGNFSETRNQTFSNLLDFFFVDEGLKTIFKTLILGLLGVHPDEASALVSMLLIREFILDGGYSPSGGMRQLPIALLKKYRKFGGDIRFNSEVTGINSNNNEIDNVLLANGDLVKADFYISAMDSKKLYLEMLKGVKMEDAFIQKIQNVKTSLSSFLMYLGIEEIQNSNIHGTIWIIDKDNFDELYKDMCSYKNSALLLNRSISLKGGKTMLIETTTLPSTNGWSNEKRKAMENQLLGLTKKYFPEISSLIKHKVNATPDTIYRWTSNYNGASFGMASNIDQFCDPDFTQKTRIKNLYVIGHWSNQSSGIPFVASTGYNVAKTLQERIKSSITS